MEPDAYQIAEATIRKHVKRMMAWDWWITGTIAGVAPTEWDAVKYGRTTVLGHHAEGMDLSEACNLGIKAVYRYAYDDIRDVIKWTDGESRQRRVALSTSEVSVEYLSVPDVYTSNFEWTDIVERSTLTRQQKDMVYLYAEGYSVKEVAEHMGMAVRTGYRRWHEAINELRIQWVDPASSS